MPYVCSVHLVPDETQMLFNDSAFESVLKLL